METAANGAPKRTEYIRIAILGVEIIALPVILWLTRHETLR